MSTKVKVDAVFLVDVTGSMGSFLSTAKTLLRKSMIKLENTGVDLTCSLIVYRDHPPQDYTFASKILCNVGTSTDIHEAMRTKHFRANGGGDNPESGLDAIIDIKKLLFRKNSLRYAFLIGDAPLHGTYKGNMNCACGLTSTDVRPVLEEYNVILTGIPLTSMYGIKESFNTVCDSVHGTGNALAHIIEDLTNIANNSRWAIDTLLPVLEKEPLRSTTEISNFIKENVNKVTRGIEILNTLGLTKQFI